MRFLLSIMPGAWVLCLLTCLPAWAGDMPPEVTVLTGGVTGIGQVTVSGAVGANDGNTSVVFEFGPTTSYGHTAAATPSTVDNGTVKTVSTVVNGLDPALTWHFRLKAVNSSGTTYGQDWAVMPGLPAAVTNAAVVTDYATVSLNGAVNGWGSNTTVSFEYGTTTSYGGSVTASPSHVGGISPTAVSATLGGLFAAKVYHYRVKAVNFFGTVYGDDVTFVPGMPTVVTLAATNVAAGTARMQGTVKGNGLPATVNFEYGPTTAYGTTVPASPSGISSDQSTTAVAQSIGSLNPAATYHYRVYAVTALGVIYGQDMTVTPQAGTPPAATTMPATAVTGGGATLQGIVNANNDGTTVTFEHGTTTSYGSVLPGSPSSVTGNSDTAVTLSLSGFAPGTTIHYRVVAKNNSSTTYGADRTFITTPNPPSVFLSGSPSCLPTSAFLSGAVNTNGGSTVVTFEYGLTTDYGESTVAWESPMSGGSGSVSGQISGLSGGTTYHYRMRAVNAGGTVTSQDQTFTTPAADPAAPVVMTQSATMVSSATAALSGTVNGNGYDTQVYFDYGMSTVYTQSVPAFGNVRGWSNTAVTGSLNGLTAGTTYHFRVRASNGHGGMVFGADRSFTTAATGVPVASTAAATLLNPTLARLNANVSANGGTVITAMAFEYGLDTSYGSIASLGGGISGMNFVTVKANIPFSGAGVTYHYRIRASTASTTVFGEDMTFVTPDPQDANLANLALGGVMLQPGFAPGTASYSASVPYDMNSIQFTAVAAQSLATVQVNGFWINGDGTSDPLKLSLGENTFNVVVTAIDGTTTQSYTVKVTRGMPKAGDPDFTFGAGSGKILINAGFSNDRCRQILMQPDGKILVAGSMMPGSSTDMSLIRLLPDGSLDLAFNGTGMVVTDNAGQSDFGMALALQPDGKILVAGYTSNGTDNDFLLLRYHGDGTPDLSFNGTGMVITSIGSGDDLVSSIALQNDGRIMVAGTAWNGSDNDFAVVRYTSTGALDTTFNTTGKVVTDFDGHFNESASGVVVQSSGRIVVAGTSEGGGTNLACYTSSGALDTSFNATGLVTTSNGMSVKAMALQADGKIVVTGVTYNGSDNDFTLVRYTDAGALDTTFGGTGSVNTNFGANSYDDPSGLVIQGDGKIVVAGRSSSAGIATFALARYDILGALDATFGSGGNVVQSFGNYDQGANTVTLQDDGKIVVAGFAGVGGNEGFAVARYLGDGPGMAVSQVLGGNLFDGLTTADIGGGLPGAVVSQTFTLTNSGLADLSGFELSITGADAGSFTAATVPAAPAPALTSSGSMTLTVHFTPSTVGVQTAVLHIASNVAGNNSSFDIALTGAGLTHAANWRQTWFGIADKTGNAADTADADGDGVPNLLEYALGMNPTVSSSQQLPQPQTVSDDFVMSIPHPAGVSGVTYAAEWSATLAADDWHPVSDSGNGSQHVFRVPIMGRTKMFMRIKVTEP
jgi:uncharacterized delta-60 repeat protein